MLISLIYLTKNGGETFRESLRMVFSQKTEFPVEVLVIDSGSNDQTLEICAGYPVRLIRIPPSSFHHSATRNLALGEARGAYCVFLVQDAIPVDSAWLARLVSPMLEKQAIAGVFGQQVSREDASPLSRSCKLLWYQEWRKDWLQAGEQLPVHPETWRDLSPREKMHCARFDNVNSCIRKSVWQSIPFPDVPYAEDLAWAGAVLTSGYSIFWQPEARVLHSHGRSLAYEFRRSYVDMKNISAIVNEPPTTMTVGQARAVIGWLIEEARRFLLEGSAGWGGTAGCANGVIAEADSRWQRQNLQKDSPRGKDGGNFPAFSRCGRSIGDILFQQYYRFLAGPEWARALCRRLPGWRRIAGSGSAPGPNPSLSLFRLELQGRHRFFLNQLLQIHFTHHQATRSSIRSIRLGAAMMVAGSLLGQQMCGMTVPARSVDERSAPAQIGYADDTEFWQLLCTWYQQQSHREHDGLPELDLLLSGGV